MGKCPFRLLGLGNCIGKKCQLYDEMLEQHQNQQTMKIEHKNVGDCSIKWLPQLITEGNAKLGRIEHKVEPKK